MPDRPDPADELIAERCRAGPGKLPGPAWTSTISRKTAARIAATLAITLSAACAPATNTTILHHHPPTAPDSPMPIFRLNQPQCDFQEIGIVKSRRPSKFTPMETVTNALRDEARKIGGDALVGVYESNVIHNPSAFFLNRDQVLSGVVIKFTDPDCAQ
ncbi:MAG: hypothetical protein OD918_11580 [Gammaproteobacteria bacterium]